MLRALLVRQTAAAAAFPAPSRSFFNFTAAAAAVESENGGLYGFPLLKTAKGFRRFADEAIERSHELLSYISRLPPSEEVIRTMDEISNTVCLVVDSAELCRNTHPDKEYVDEANEAAMRIYEHIQFLNTNHSLYNVLVRAELEGHLQTEEAKRVAHNFRMDFEKGGIHLFPEKLERVSQLNMEITELGREFNENIINDPGYVDTFPASRIPKHMQCYFKPISRRSAKEKGFRIMTDFSTLVPVLKLVPDAQVRKVAYIKGHSSPHANLGVLDKLISSRNELAQIMGCKSYAEFSIGPNMALSPDVVSTFLHNLSDVVRDKADKEFGEKLDFKRKMGDDMSEGLELWDEAFVGERMKSSVYDLNSSAIASYFPLSQCIEGLKLLVESLFGATFISIPFAPGESWHPDVIKLVLHHPEEGDLGYLYLDLYSRKGKKYLGCAHFVVRGGRRISETEYQLPIVALVCNFPSSGSSSPVLHHTNVETLFHEFGHALHSLLSRTDYQHFSGTRVVLDLAETPSNLFEYYAWDYRVLRRFAKHHSTGEVIPEKLVEAMKGARSMSSAIDLQRSIYHSLVDLKLFGEQPACGLDTTAVVAGLMRQHTCWNHVEGTHWQTRFTHFTNYGAGYYTYLYARCFAATVWEKICSEDPLSPSVGHALRTKFLQHGGAKDPSEMLMDLAGSSILRKINGGIVPDISSLRNEMGL